RPHRRAQIDAHVKDCISTVPPHISTRIKLPDNHGNIGFQEARSDNDKSKRKPENTDYRIIDMPHCGITLKCHEEMARGQQYCPEENRLSLPKIAVSQIPPDHRRNINQRCI